MKPLSRDVAEAFARTWIEAWNAKDLDRILAHYSDDYELRSPLIAQLGIAPSGYLSGKARVADYWRKALTKVGELHFELVDLLLGVDNMTIYYRGHRGMVAETLFFNEHGYVRMAAACYSTREG